MNELDSTCGVSDDELTERFKEAIRLFLRVLTEAANLQ